MVTLDRTAAARGAAVGMQKTDTGPLNRKRMETIDDETTTAVSAFFAGLAIGSYWFGKRADRPLPG